MNKSIQIEQFAKAAAVVQTFQRHVLSLSLKSNVAALAAWYDKAAKIDIENELDKYEEHKYVLRAEFEDNDEDPIDILEKTFLKTKETLEAFNIFMEER